MPGVLWAVAANGDAERRIVMVICRRIKYEYSWERPHDLALIERALFGIVSRFACWSGM